jgi:hypothetical protein
MRANRGRLGKPRDGLRRRLGWRGGPTLWAVCGLFCSLPWLAAPAAAQTAGIYTCVDDRGRKLTSDRPIADCVGKEQRVLNRDGSLREVRPPTMTAEERAEADARERKAQEARMAQADVVRRDRNLMLRYPNEAAHQKARNTALENVRQAMRSSEARLKELERDRKPLLNEAEFYKGKPMPPKLKGQMDANDVAAEAQRAAMVNQEAEIVRLDRLYDVELDRLKKLWAGARPGSLGPMPSATQGDLKR